MSTSTSILDFYDDTDHALMNKLAMPESVRCAQMNPLTDEELNSLPDTEFGLIVLTKRASVLRKFPVNDPGNAWLSAQYFSANHEKLAFPARFIAATFIKNACDAYGVPSSKLVEGYAARADDSDVEVNTFSEGSESSWMLRKLAQQELTSSSVTAGQVDASLAMPNEHFALIVRQGDGSVIRKYAMPDASHVKIAAEYFDKYAMQLPPEHRHKFAQSVKNRAEDLNVDVDGHDLHKWASDEWNRHVHSHIEHRKELLPRNQDARSILDKLAAAIGQGATTPEDAASVLKTVDEATGLNRHYDSDVADPYRSTMGKSASGWSVDLDGRTITEGDLKKAAKSQRLAAYLGAGFCKQFEKNPIEIFESLPAPEKDVVAQVISGEA